MAHFQPQDIVFNRYYNELKINFSLVFFSDASLKFVKLSVGALSFSHFLVFMFTYVRLMIQAKDMPYN